MTYDELLTKLSNNGFTVSKKYNYVFYEDIHFGNIIYCGDSPDDTEFYVATTIYNRKKFIPRPGYKPELRYIDLSYFENYLIDFVKSFKFKKIELRKKELTQDFK